MDSQINLSGVNLSGSNVAIGSSGFTQNIGGKPAKGAIIKSNDTKHLDTPNSDKLLASDDEHQTLVEFCEWLECQGYVIAQYGADHYLSDTLFPVGKNDSIIMDHLGIDEVELEKERRAIIDAIDS